MKPNEHADAHATLLSLARGALAKLARPETLRLGLRDALDAGDLLVIYGERGFVPDRALLIELERTLRETASKVPELISRERAAAERGPAVPETNLRCRALTAVQQLQSGLAPAYRGLFEAGVES